MQSGLGFGLRRGVGLNGSRRFVLSDCIKSETSLQLLLVVLSSLAVWARVCIFSILGTFKSLLQPLNCCGTSVAEVAGGEAIPSAGDFHWHMSFASWDTTLNIAQTSF